MAISGAVLQPRSPSFITGDGTMAVVRIRIEELERVVNETFESHEDFVRAADISKSAWYSLRDEKKQRVDLGVLAKVLSTLNLGLGDIIQYDPDEKIA